MNTAHRLALSLLMLACFGMAAADYVPQTLAIGAEAPDFSLPGIDGKTHTLKDYADAKVLVIVFNSNHCPTAQAYEDRLIKMTNDYKDKGVALVAINPNNNEGLRLDELGYTDLDDSFESMKVRAAEHKFNFPYLDDGPTQATAKAYGCKATPHAFVFDAARKLRYQGRIDDNEYEGYVKSPDLRNAIDELLAGKDVSVKETRAFGCSTKWKEKNESVKKWMEKVAKEPITLELVDEAGLKALRKGDPEKVRLVNFWSTTCGPCIAEMPELVEINLMYRNRPFETVTVASNFPGEKSEVLQLLEKKHVNCKNLLLGSNDKQTLQAAFDPDWDATLPYTLLIGKKGEVLYKASGQFDPLELKRAIVNAIGRYYAPKEK
jgi:thiol-disulfide isomerase/thioredoxin